MSLVVQPSAPPASPAGRPGAVPRGLDDLLCLDDVEAAARAVLPAAVSSYVAGGSGGEVTLRASRAAFDAVQLVPRVLAGVASGDLTTRVAGTELSMPVAVAPMAYQRLLHPDGELALARAARDAGVVFVASMLGSYPVEQIAATGAQTWFQLYWLHDRRLASDLIERAETAGCRALMLTVDVPRMGRWLRDMPARFALPGDLLAADLPDQLAAPSWLDVDWLRRRTALPLVLKGVLHADDAVRAVQLGVDAVVVSTHGGRQLDGAVPSIAALPAVRAAVGDRCEVLLDSGVRSGVDVLRAVALGAGAVLLGRPALWGLAAGGERGAARVLELLRAEIEESMVFTGCTGIAAARTVTAVVTERGRLP